MRDVSDAALSAVGGFKGFVTAERVQRLARVQDGRCCGCGNPLDFGSETLVAVQFLEGTVFGVAHGDCASGVQSISDWLDLRMRVARQYEVDKDDTLSRLENTLARLWMDAFEPPRAEVPDFLKNRRKPSAKGGS